jgi:hypothetical protein
MVSQVAGLQRSLDALRLGNEHAALVAYCEGLAAQIDLTPEVAALWREYRPALEHLLALGEVLNDAQNVVLELVSTPVRDPETL